eukprot:291496_1
MIPINFSVIWNRMKREMKRECACVKETKRIECSVKKMKEKSYSTSFYTKLHKIRGVEKGRRKHVIIDSKAYEDIMDRQRDRKRKREEDESNNGALPPQRRRLNGDENDEVMDVLSNNGRLTDDTMNMNAQRVHNEDVTSPSHTATQTRTIPETPEQPPMDTQYEQNNGHNTNNNEDVTSPSHTATQTRTIPETPEQPPMDTQYELQNNGHN